MPGASHHSGWQVMLAAALRASYCNTHHPLARRPTDSVMAYGWLKTPLSFGDDKTLMIGRNEHTIEHNLTGGIRVV